MTRALQEKKPVIIQMHPTIADSAASLIASNNAYHIVRGYLDRMVRLLKMLYCSIVLCLHPTTKIDSLGYRYLSGDCYAMVVSTRLF